MRSAVDAGRRELERIGYEIWRAPDTEELDGWRLRFAHGVTGRANSVWPNADEGALALDEKIDRVEAWYAARGAGARFQLTDAAVPAGLAAALEARGYRQAGTETNVEVAELTSAEAPRGVDVREELDDTWLELWTGGREFDDLAVARALVTGSPGRTAFARVGEVAIGRGVAVDGWLGVTSMYTVPGARGRGHGSAVLRALVAWARAAGCTRGLLQVDSTAGPALALYAREGFRQAYRYRYVVREVKLA